MADPETSHEAASSVLARTRTITQDAIFRILLEQGPMCDEELYPRLVGMEIETSPSGARTRRSELVAQHRIEFSGTYRTTASNRRTRLWCISTQQNESGIS
jgi:hypothetical protein